MDLTDALLLVGLALIAAGVGVLAGWPWALVAVGAGLVLFALLREYTS